MKKSIYIKHKFHRLVDVTNIITMHYFEFNKNYKFDGETHDFWEFVYVDKGEVIITADGQEMELKQGEIYLHRPLEQHSIRANGIVAPNVLILTFSCKSTAMACLQGVKHKAPKGSSSILSHINTECSNTFVIPFFDPYLRKLELKPNPPIGGQQMIKLYLEQLLILLIRQINQSDIEYKVFESQDSLNNHLISHIIELMSQKVYSHITVDEICQSVNFGKTYVCTLFKRETGHTIIEYYNILKMAQAKRLIREGQENLTKIAEILGFETPQYFYRAFKKIVGMSPKEYKNSIR